MKIAVDAMGGDHAPQAIVEGALLALQEYQDIEIVLVGQKEAIEPLLKTKERISIVHAASTIAMDEEPVKAIRRKKDSSMVMAAQLLREKEVDACISAGNTGAYMTAGLLIVGRMQGMERPALATFFPTRTDQVSLVLDVGANLDAKPEHLYQYAVMGNVYAQKILGYVSPKIGLLNVGTEESKGNTLTKATFSLLKNSSLDFIGNIEARDATSGHANVIVCEGFAGNVLLKTTEGTASTIFTLLKEELTRNIVTKLAAAIIKPGLKKFKERMDYTEYGGAPLLGVNGICIKAHGSSNAYAIKNAIRQARKLHQHQIMEEISTSLSETRQVLEDSLAEEDSTNM